MNFMNSNYKCFLITTCFVFAYSYWYLNNDEVAIILNEYKNSAFPISQQINTFIYCEFLRGTSITLLIVHSTYLYFYLLNFIFDDIECIIKYHILYIILYMSNIYSMNFFELNTWLILFGSIYSSKYVYKVGKKYFNLL